MKEINNIEIGKKNQATEAEDKALTVAPNAQITNFKQFVSKSWAFLVGKESTDSSALLKLGIAVKKYRFSLAIIGLVFMLIFRNDNTKAIGLNIDENKAINSKKEPVTKILKVKETPKSTKTTYKSPVTSTKVQTVKKVSNATEQPEALKSYHVPNIPELSNKRKMSSDLAKNSEKSLKLYISKYLKIAREESVKLNVPTSVILGLAIMNSSYGFSKTAIEANNHFDVKCGENSIPMGKGMKGQYVSNDYCFTKYNTVWASYCAHSNLVSKILKKYGKTNQNTIASIVSSLDKGEYFNNRSFSAEDFLQFIEENNLNKYNK